MFFVLVEFIKTGLKFRLFEEVRMDLMFGFGGQTWVQVSSKFELSSWKQFKVDYSWGRFNTYLIARKDIVII